MNRYAGRIYNKTEKTLARLAKWERKIKKSLYKVSPETANQLFAPNIPTFESMLADYKKGMVDLKGYNKYNKYLDNLSTNLKYLEQHLDLTDSSGMFRIKSASENLKDLEHEVAASEKLEQFIKERKKKLINESVKYLAKNKHLQKINKEAFYYAETLKNYKEIFSDEKKVEQLAVNALKKVPGFSEFIKKNNALAGLFNVPSNYGTPASLTGLQTRNSIDNMLNSRLAMGGPDSRSLIQQNIQNSRNELARLKSEYLKGLNNGNVPELPDFKPNMQKTKTFFQRLEYGFDIQFGKKSSFIPSTTDIAFTIGYRLNDKSVVGLGANYKLGIGPVNKISFSNEGIGFRSFIDWKLKKQFFLTGGYESNYYSSFKNLPEVIYSDSWQQSGLIGITKKVKSGSKTFKNLKLQLLYDFLSGQQTPVGKSFIYRIGYTF